MPRYDYECGTCHHTFELRQSFDSETTAECPNCQNVSHRKFHSVPVMFKGSGWYVNDYGKRGSSSDTSSDSKDSSEDKSESKPKSESKSDSSTDPKPKSEKKSDTKSDSSTKVPSKAGSASAKRNGN